MYDPMKIMENEEFERERQQKEQEQFIRDRKKYLRKISKKKSIPDCLGGDDDILGLEFEDERWERAWGLEGPYIQGYEERDW